ncbi:MAG: hypothetical protein AB8B95_08230 [Pseudohongiellaceae bacterium]
MGYTRQLQRGVGTISELSQNDSATAEEPKSFLATLLSGGYGLALTYWGFYFIGSGLFFTFGSRAVDSQQWITYFIMVAAMLAYTVILIIGIRAAYQGPQLWKVMSRTSSVFMIINILVGISTLGFIY